MWPQAHLGYIRPYLKEKRLVRLKILSLMIYDYIHIQKLESFVLIAVKARDSLCCLCTNISATILRS